MNVAILEGPEGANLNHCPVGAPAREDLSIGPRSRCEPHGSGTFGSGLAEFSSKRNIERKLMYTYIHTYIHTYIPYHTIPYHTIPLHYITLHYITLHYITLHYITLHYITYIHTYIYNIVIYLYNYIYMCVCVCVYVYIYICIFISIYIYIYTQINLLFDLQSYSSSFQENWIASQQWFTKSYKSW